MTRRLHLPGPDVVRVGRYRDLMLCVVFTGKEGLRIIGEIQVPR